MANESAPQPWYHAGLRFKCTQCGDCCTGAPGFVWVNKQEIHDLAARTKMGVEEFERQYVREVGVRKSLKEYDNGDCVFLDPQTRGCRVYEARPRQCRTWPFWDSNLKYPETWAQTAEVCPGCDKGKKVYSLEHIEEQRTKFRL